MFNAFLENFSLTIEQILLKTLIWQSRAMSKILIFFYNKSLKISMMEQLTKGLENQTQKSKAERLLPGISHWKASFCKLKPYFENIHMAKAGINWHKSYFSPSVGAAFLCELLKRPWGISAAHKQSACAAGKKNNRHSQKQLLCDAKQKTLFIGRKITNANSLPGITPAAFAFSACR
jgi:hypothetical protein